MDGTQTIKRIHVLDKKVSELIAAGEVVERPASAVKELLENAIDAGASMITLEIKNGGVKFIRVTDNGGGITRDDVPKAFLRHATSKVLTQEDLAAIGTLGFRGEALASICAVSKTELITRTADELAGTHVILEGGEIAESGDAGCPVGTTIIVRELFYNTPARMKFLKKDTTEGNAVAAIAQRIALSHPEISFRFVKDGREELHTPGDNRPLSAIHSVLGREFAHSLLNTDYTLAHAHVSGFVTKPLAARPNRNMQFFFLNGRFVKSKTMMAAIEAAYKNSIMTGKFPGCVLYLTINPAVADINVHPAKLEVRFANEREIFEAVYYAAKNALAQSDERPVMGLEAAEKIAAASISKPVFGTVSGKSAASGVLAGNSWTNRAASDEEREKQLRFILQNTPHQSETENIPLRNASRAAYEPVAGGSVETKDTPQNNEFSGFAPQNNIQNENTVKDNTQSNTLSINENEKKSPEIIIAEEKPQSVKIIGQCFGTYILAQKGDSLFIIDKHAAHERILYERVKSERKAASQVLLEPVTVALPAEEYAAAVDNLELLRDAGIAAEDFGGSTLLVREAPLDLAGEDIPALISEIAGILLSHKKDIVPEKLDWLFHSVACRAAIKAHDRTTLPEMQSLAERVLLDNDIRYCPHGRPVAFELPKSEIEKKFGR